MYKVLITGATGMVGQNLCSHSISSEFELITPSSKELDLRDFDAVRQFINESSPKIAVHCAGRVGGIEANIKNGSGFLVDNFEMGKNLVLAAKECGVERVINLGSSCMYPRNAKNPLVEKDVLNGALEPTNEGYALAKIAVARLCEYICRESPEFKFKTLIPCNIYGKYDSFDTRRSHMVPAIIRKLHEAKVRKNNQVEIWGDGTARREFMYAEDLADFIWYAVKKFDDLPNNINIGLGRDYSVDEYYALAAEVVGYEGGFIHDHSKPVGMKQKLVDTQLQTNFGWVPRHSLRSGLQSTYDYFLEKFA